MQLDASVATIVGSRNQGVSKFGRQQLAHFLSHLNLRPVCLIRMLEVRPFAGTPDELADFIVSAWQSTYAGKMSVPQWSGDYFRWQLRLDEPDSAQRLKAVYRGEELVGTMLYVPMTFEMAGQHVQAAQASWLSVPAEHRGQGIGRMLHQAAQTQLRQEGLEFRLGYGYTGSKVSLGPGFWKKQAGDVSTVPRRAGFWGRLLDAGRAAAWNVNRGEAWLTGAARPFVFQPRRRNPGGIEIRPIKAEDIPVCLDLADRATEHCDLRLIWDADRLSRQLGLQGFGRALVAVENGVVRGCIGFHVLPIAGRTVEPIGILDLVFVSELSTAARNELLNSVLLEMHQEGAIMALKLRTGDYPTRTFLKPDWFLKPADMDVIITGTDTSMTIPPLRRLHVLWR